MRIERIDDKTVKCYLTNEEMAEFEITYKDFVTRSQKAKEVVERIIVQAVEEVGYKPPEFAMDMQIMLLPEQGMVLTLSERTPEEIRNNPMLMEYLREMKRVFEQKMLEDGVTPENMQEHLEKLFGGEGGNLIAGGIMGALAAGTRKSTGNSAGQIEKKEAGGEIRTQGQNDAGEESQMPDFAVFAFSSLRALYDYVSVLPKILRVGSRLYKEKDTFYLYLEKGTSAYKRYSKTCILAMEYGTLYGASEDKVCYLQEHGECLIEEKAIQKLRM